jgi:hypothetical protein
VEPVARSMRYDRPSGAGDEAKSILPKGDPKVCCLNFVFPLLFLFPLKRKVKKRVENFTCYDLKKNDSRQERQSLNRSVGLTHDQLVA